MCCCPTDLPFEASADRPTNNNCQQEHKAHNLIGARTGDRSQIHSFTSPYYTLSCYLTHRQRVSIKGKVHAVHVPNTLYYPGVGNVTLPMPKGKGLLVSTGAVTHHPKMAPLALSTMAPSEPRHAVNQHVKCFLRHSRLDLRCSYTGGRHAYGH